MVCVRSGQSLCNDSFTQGDVHSRGLHRHRPEGYHMFLFAPRSDPFQPREALRGGIPGSFLEPLGRS